jgi:ABC-type multidrug transport system fused ATPase/permease subunit
MAVLSDLSFEIEAGKATALVGPSGSGKSTISALLLALYQKYEGEIFINGQELRSLDPRAWRELIALVPQEPHLFALSIADNLRYARPSATIADLEQACQKAEILSFIKSLPQGFNTILGERGLSLSGGQRQRIAIARAFLRNPAFLILDEATASLDSENEHLIHQALKTLMKGRTVLIIAHRLSTIREVDHILVLENGKLIQSGTHSGLSVEQGLYRQLVEHQNL